MKKTSNLLVALFAAVAI
jgi:hypothetical protein